MDDLLPRIWATFLTWLPLLLWIVWWRWAVNWQRLAPALRSGAWAPVLLLIIMAAAVWSRIAPAECACLGFVVIPNFLWQLGAMIGLLLLALFCGWLQGVYGFVPLEVSLEPPAHAADHGHHGHGH